MEALIVILAVIGVAALVGIIYAVTQVIMVDREVTELRTAINELKQTIEQLPGSRPALSQPKPGENPGTAW